MANATRPKRSRRSWRWSSGVSKMNIRLKGCCGGGVEGQGLAHPGVRGMDATASRDQLMEAAAKNHQSVSNGAELQLLALLETLYNSRNPTRRWLHCTRRDWITAKVAEYASGRPRRALEVGFGAGAYLPALCESFREVVASDLDQAHLDHARAISAKYPNLRLATDDITASELPEHSFDLVL